MTIMKICVRSLPFHRTSYIVNCLPFFNRLALFSRDLGINFSVRSMIMKTILFIAALFLTQQIFAQTEVSREADGTKILKGFITRQELSTDSAFTWFLQNQKGYTPQQESLNTLRANKDSINILAFGGTWCGDTKHLLPQFYVFADAAGLSPDRITLIGVDRSKKTIQHLSEAFNITNVPTFIVLKNGKEIGRVVEYGKSGMIDREISEVITSAKRF
jgi:thiol-disulfide isomerase/thioredoxin